VRAPARSMGLIEQLIQELDQLPSAEAQIKVFEVRNGDPLTLAQALQQLFGLPVTAGQNATGGIFGQNTQLQLAGLTAGDGALVPLRITTDYRTRSIIASGARSTLEVIEAVLLRLDADAAQARTTEVIWLRNANANDVATALGTFINNQRQVTQTQQLLGQALLIEQNDLFVVAEPTTNSLILSASPRNLENLQRVVAKLDRRPPLVAVQVLMAEVVLGDQFEWGAEWGLQDSLLFDRRSATGGTLGSPVFNTGTVLTNTVTSGSPGNVAGQGLSTFGLGRASTGLGYGGLVLSAASESVGVLIRALQDANRLQILSRPQIMTMDNRPAGTLVGQIVPRVQGVTNAQFGQTVNAVDTPVGLELQVWPRVNEDGLIVMQVYVQRSAVDDVNAGIPVGFGVNGEVIRSPIINSTNAQTTISAYSGQTVVFAGLIQKSRSSTSRRIPYLADIPWLGALFRFDVESERRTELLVVLTPRIIQTDEDYEMMKQVESSRMSWCLADILEMHGDAGLSGGHGLWGPARGPIIYPDLQPTAIEHAPPYDTILEAPLVPQGAVPAVGGVLGEPQAGYNFPANGAVQPVSYEQRVNAPAYSIPPGYRPPAGSTPLPTVPANPATPGGMQTTTIRR
jgi:general secretion pathway protein D